MKGEVPIKISKEGIDFLKRLKINRIKTDVDKEEISYWKVIELIGKYFKYNNDAYLELIKLKWSKSV